MSTVTQRSRRTGRVYTLAEIAQGVARQNDREGIRYTGDTHSPTGSGLRSERFDVAYEHARLGGSLADYDSMRNSRDAAVRAQADSFDKSAREVRAFSRLLRVPDAESRDLSTAVSGGYLIPKSMEPGVLFAVRYASFIGQLRLWKSVNPVTGQPHGGAASYPMLVGDVANKSISIGDDTLATPNDFVFSQVSFPQAPGQVLELGRYSRALVADTNVPILDIVTEAVAQRVARFADGLAVTNLLAAATLNQTTATSGVVVYADIVNWVERLSDISLMGSPTSCIVVSPSTLAKFRLMVDGNGRPLTDVGSITVTTPDSVASDLFGGDEQNARTIRVPTILGLPILTSANLPAFAAGAVVGFVGDMNQAGVLRFVSCAVQPLLERYSDFGEIAYLGYARCDVQAADLSSYATLTVHV
jgi:predicted phage gp36 major capsid-like protein